MHYTVSKCAYKGAHTLHLGQLFMQQVSNKNVGILKGVNQYPIWWILYKKLGASFLSPGMKRQR
jgi:hypothetical protein